MFEAQNLTVYNIKMVQNCINEYMVIYLNKPNDVINAQRPSSAKCFTHEIFWSLDVNGAATDASAWMKCYQVLDFFLLMKIPSMPYLWQWYSDMCCLKKKQIISILFIARLWLRLTNITFRAPQSFAPSPHIATI